MISFPPIALVEGLKRHTPVAHSYPVGADEHPADESRRVEEMELARASLRRLCSSASCCGCCNRIDEKSCDTDLPVRRPSNRTGNAVNGGEGYSVRTPVSPAPSSG